MVEQFPKRLNDYSNRVTIELPEKMGAGAKIYLREIAKEQLPALYHQPIETGISGRTDIGQEIPINTVGRWLFGTPGYMGHIRVTNWDGCDAMVEFPKDSPVIVKDLIAGMKETIEANNQES
jgi:hypothetical protein